MVGFQVTVLEDRPKFADSARKEGADRVICAPYEKALAEEKLDEDTYVVIVTRGHRYDSACLYSVLDRKEECAYVGMMGSRRRTAIVKEQMIQLGISQEKVGKVCTPIGLAIGAETPEEIAVSILGEIIEVKNRSRAKAAIRKNFWMASWKRGKAERKLYWLLLFPERAQLQGAWVRKCSF